MKRIKVETTSTGIALNISRAAGTDIVVRLAGPEGPALATAVLHALEPHFPDSASAAPMSVFMSVRGFSWQAGVSPDQSKIVHLTIKPPEIPGIHLICEPSLASALGRALI